MPYNDSEYRTVVCPGERRNERMTHKEDLLSYISALTEEQVEKIINQIPRLISLLAESSPLCHQEQTLQNQ